MKLLGRTYCLLEPLHSLIVPSIRRRFLSGSFSILPRTDGTDPGMTSIPLPLGAVLQEDLEKKVVHLVGEGADTDNVRIRKAVERGADLLRLGGVLGVPTDTVYGVAADAQNNEAISRIYQIKGRDFRKPIAICVSSIPEVYHWGKVGVPQSLLEDLLPGPVTLVFERQPSLNPNLNPSTSLIGIRIPDNQFIVELAKRHSGPIALTSANFSSHQSTLEVQEFKDLWPSLDLIFDGGRLSTCEKTEKAARAGSTVIDLSSIGFYRIIRDGTAREESLNILKNKYNYQEKIDEKNNNYS